MKFNNIELKDIISVEEIQSMLSDFYEFTGLPVAIIDLKGRVLCSAGWQDICTRFHRVHPETRKTCIESDIHMTKGIPEGEYKAYKCKNNLWDVATPIMVKERQMGNLFIGQFIFDDEHVDYDLFRSQAKKHGFDETEYIKALEQVPRPNRDTVKNAMCFFVKVAQQISSLGYSNYELYQTLEGTIRTIGHIMEKRDPYTAKHQKRVAEIASTIAKEMGLKQERIESLRLAAKIHDIGKMSIPTDILSKPDKIEKAEFELIKNHPQEGYEILKDIEFPWPVADIVVQHHEKIDGGGYPKGLSGDEILLESKILCLADVVEAMASHRPYRPALGIDVALEEIWQKRGVLFDEEVVDACIRVFREKDFGLEKQKAPKEAKE